MLAPLGKAWEPGRPWVIAHRGASVVAPENTMAAFQRAVEQGADAIELDVHLSRDGVPMVIHDETLERTTSGKGRVGEHTGAWLQKLDAGSWFGPAFAGERVPTLREVVEWAEGRAYLLIELKMAPVRYAGMEERVVEVLEAASALHRVEVFSFDHRCSQRLRKLCPDLLTGVCYVGGPISPGRLALDAKANVLHPQWAYVTPSMVGQAHRRGLRVVPWPVSDPETACGLAEMGADGIVTAEPARVRMAVMGIHGRG